MLDSFRKLRRRKWRKAQSSSSNQPQNPPELTASELTVANFSNQTQILEYKSGDPSQPIPIATAGDSDRDLSSKKAGALTGLTGAEIIPFKFRVDHDTLSQVYERWKPASALFTKGTLCVYVVTM